jgi:imidazolonepropionase-like amidohydrolase
MHYILFLIFPLFLSSIHSRAQQEDFTVIKNVNIVSVEDGKILKNMMVAIKGEKIISIKGRFQRTGKNVKVIDGTGKYLIPGLADMHVHLPDSNIADFLETSLHAGVTTIRSMRGDFSNLELKGKVLRNEIYSPRLFISAPPFYTEANISIHSLRDTIRSYHNMGFHLIKILTVPNESYFDTLMISAKKFGMKVAGHCPTNVDFKKVLGSGISSLEHLGGYYPLFIKDSLQIQEAIKMSVANNIYNCATVDWYAISFGLIPKKELESRQGLKFISAVGLANWKRELNSAIEKQAFAKNRDSVNAQILKRKNHIKIKLRLLKQLDIAGAKLLISPDATAMYQVPGFSMVEEMKLHQAAGIAPYKILKAATLNAALYFEDDSWGIIKTGKIADLVLLNKNPLENIENVSAIEDVCFRGKWISETPSKGRK